MFLASSYGYDVGCAVVGTYFWILFFALIIDAVIAGITAKIASDKGRSGAGWFCLSFFLLGVIALIIILCLSDDSYTPSSTNRSSSNYSSTWVCPNCFRTNSGTSICVNCGTQKPVSATRSWTCNNCGTENYGGLLCKKCGEPRYKEKENVDKKWKCEKCGTENDGKFCKNCGTQKPSLKEDASWECTKCGTKNDSKFCKNCGAPKNQ